MDSYTFSEKLQIFLHPLIAAWQEPWVRICLVTILIAIILICVLTAILQVYSEKEATDVR